MKGALLKLTFYRLFGLFRLFTVPYFSVRSLRYRIARLTVNGGHHDFQMYMYQGGGRREL